MKKPSPSGAWFESSHPAKGRPCPACGARIGKPCVSLIGIPGTCVSAGLTLAGMHFERLSSEVAAS